MSKIDLVIGILEDQGNLGAAYCVRELIEQRDELLAACEAFIRYDEGDQEDGLQLMIDYAEADNLIRAAVANAKK